MSEHPEDVTVVGMMSTYVEGRLFVPAVDSLLAVGLDHLYVFEGPAGDPLPNEAELPPTRLEHVEGRAGVTVHRNRWRTDGRKRNDMLQRAKQEWPGPVWAVVLDADEILVNGAFLRDRLEWIMASDAHRGASIATPQNPPMARWPLRLIEHDGSMSLITARVFRIDYLRSIDHSSSVVTNVAGVRDGWGNIGEMSAVWIERWLQAVDRGHMVAWPPLPTEPHIAHRSNLRTPGRRGLRMSDQETLEFRKAMEEEGQA